MNTLIVLDINGLVCRKGDKGIVISPYYSIEPIEGYMKFVDDILSLGYDISWFTSTSYKNASKILKELNLYNKPSVFKWYSSGNVKDLAIVKNKFPHYNRYIIVDDTPEKILCNNEDERIIFEGSYSDTLEHINHMSK